MATTTKNRSSSTSALRSANAAKEARAKDGTFKRVGDSFEGKGGVIGAAAAGLAIGLAANVARKLAVQAPTALAGDWDQALAAEHTVTLKLFDALEGTTERNTTKRAMLLMQLKHALGKHAMQEENVVYPAMREAGDVEAADHLNNDHGYVKQYLYELGEVPKDSPAWIQKVRKFRADIEKHMREEEDTLFPALKRRLSPAKNKELTGLMNKEGLKLA